MTWTALTPPGKPEQPELRGEQDVRPKARFFKSGVSHAGSAEEVSPCVAGPRPMDGGSGPACCRPQLQLGFEMGKALLRSGRFGVRHGANGRTRLQPPATSYGNRDRVSATSFTDRRAWSSVWRTARRACCPTHPDRARQQGDTQRPTRSFASPAPTRRPDRSAKLPTA